MMEYRYVHINMLHHITMTHGEGLCRLLGRTGMLMLPIAAMW